MMVEAILGMLVTRPNRPLNALSVAVALFVPGSLIILLARPSLYESLGINGVLLISVAISSPILAIWYSVFHTPLFALRHEFKKRFLPLAPKPNPFDELDDDDPLETPCLFIAA